LKHLKQNNETYINHLFFSGKIGLTLVFQGFLFILHALFPICDIPYRWNLSAIESNVQKWNKYTIRRIKK